MRVFGSYNPYSVEYCRVCLKVSNKKFSRLEKLINPSINYLKFNVDGSAKGSLGYTGIGGVLRDHLGKVLCFSLLM